MTFDLCGERRQVVLPLAGAFQAHNVLAALGLAIATDCDREAAFAALPGLLGVPGRMEHVGRTPSGGEIYVDYAHTPDALAAALQSARPHARGRLVVVFGCGGDRDPGKRPQMGRLAGELAELPIVTTDNPRSEDPLAIIRAVETGLRESGNPRYRVVPDRREAIRRAVAAAGERGWVVLVAGKGNEPVQLVGDRSVPFYDHDVAAEALAERYGQTVGG
jgi:UDP-N-acetylmuramoyl-L-alanyl-D-glutamate--2,6-diaminopimelate ligase